MPFYLKPGFGGTTNNCSRQEENKKTNKKITSKGDILQQLIIVKATYGNMYGNRNIGKRALSGKAPFSCEDIRCLQACEILDRVSSYLEIFDK